MKKLLLGLAVLPFLAGVSMAGSPTPLTNQQMDKVTAGFDFFELDITNTSATIVAADLPDLGTCSTCYLHVSGTAYPVGVRSLQVYSQFGP
ncbi:MAG TPA: hypothetical protein VJ770_21770 [Stellaceae bacterium]|nr:hypothetical protein [Stellaceae bacterium]